MDNVILFAYELSRNNLELRTSTIPHAVYGIFKTVPIGTNTVMGYYYGTLVYGNLSISSSRRPAVYGESVLGLTTKDFSKWEVHLQLKTEYKRYVWIFPAPFCAMSLINDARYTEKEMGHSTS